MTEPELAVGGPGGTITGIMTGGSTGPRKASATTSAIKPKSVTHLPSSSKYEAITYGDLT